MRYGRLTSVKFVGTKKGHPQVLYRCDCGTEKVLYREHVISGKTVSCGCAQLEWCQKLGELNTTHGDSNSPEYKAWQSMKTRCYSETYHCTERYLGRGITVCDEWKDSYETFLKDMGRRPSGNHSLDRRNNSLGYSKDNCRWATPFEQIHNRG